MPYKYAHLPARPSPVTPRIKGAASLNSRSSYRQARLLIEISAIFLALAFSTEMLRAQVNAPDFCRRSARSQNETQYYPQVLNSQMQWIVNNQKGLNIQMVLTEGDNINDGTSTAQLQNLDSAFRLLDNAGIPYLLGIGNHDYNGGNPKARDLTGFNQWFGPGRCTGKALFQRELSRWE